MATERISVSDLAMYGVGAFAAVSFTGFLGGLVYAAATGTLTLSSGPIHYHNGVILSASAGKAAAAGGAAKVAGGGAALSAKAAAGAAAGGAVTYSAAAIAGMVVGGIAALGVVVLWCWGLL